MVDDARQPGGEQHNKRRGAEDTSQGNHAVDKKNKRQERTMRGNQTRQEWTTPGDRTAVNTKRGER
jgi:hypothetical protein